LRKIEWLWGTQTSLIRAHIYSGHPLTPLCSNRAALPIPWVFINDFHYKDTYDSGGSVVAFLTQKLLSRILSLPNMEPYTIGKGQSATQER
jgi:hypothetical protein